MEYAEITLSAGLFSIVRVQGSAGVRGHLISVFCGSHKCRFEAEEVKWECVYFCPQTFFQINVDFCINFVKLYLWLSLYKYFWDFQPTLHPRVLSIKQDHITVFSLFTLIMLIICHFQLWLCCQLGQQICKISRNPLPAKTISVVFQSVPTALGMLLEAMEVLLSVGQNYVCGGVWGLFCFVLFLSQWSQLSFTLKQPTASLPVLLHYIISEGEWQLHD